jgi:glyoxylase-like metal-dependent hydrolase (beta-lactamase superfamily II)
MNLRMFALSLGLALAASFDAEAQPSSAKPMTFPVVQGKTFKFEKIADGVYYATGGVGSNNVVIVNDNDVMLVDTGTTPANARNFVADVKMLTNKPIKYVVNTHWHYDHTDGNQIFGSDVQIIGHEFVKEMITKGDVLHKEPYLTSVSTAAPAVLADLKELKPTAPTRTYKDKLVIQAGSREIQLLNFGRGHTGGDTVVFLPKEKIVASGDLMESRLAYMGDAYFDEWVECLDKLKKLDFTVDLPGHGIPFSDKGLITAFQDYLNDLIVKGNELKRSGVTPEDAAKRIDMTSHAKNFPQITGPGVDVRGARRLYAWLDERGGG